MPRTSVTLTESALNLADSRAKEKGLTRSDYIAAAVESALNQTESDLNQLAEKDKIIESMKLELNQLESDLNQSKKELNQAQLELMQSRRSISKLENQLAEKDKTIESTRRELNQRDSNLNQLESELNQAQLDLAKLESAMKAKDGEVSFLRGHVSQLTQRISQFALKPGEEEIKKKGWWQFWR